MIEDEEVAKVVSTYTLSVVDCEMFLSFVYFDDNATVLVKLTHSLKCYEAPGLPSVNMV